MNETFLDDIPKTAKILLQNSIDLDFGDYVENTDLILLDLEDVLQYLKAVCENSYNRESFRTFARCLDAITETITLNETIFCGNMNI